MLLIYHGFGLHKGAGSKDKDLSHALLIAQ